MRPEEADKPSEGKPGLVLGTDQDRTRKVFALYL